MKTQKRAQTSLDNEISFIDIFQFLIFNRKLIATFIIIGGILGGLYGQLSKPVYNGSILLAPAKISGVFIENPQKTFSIFKAKNNDFLKEKFPLCPLSAIKNINFSNADGSNFSAAKEIILIKISMQNTDKTIINDCLNQVADELSLSQNKIAQPLIDFKKNKLKILIEVSNKIKEQMSTNMPTFNDKLLIAEIILNSISETRMLNEYNFMSDDIAHKVSSVNIERKPFPSFKYSALLGIMWGFGLGLLIALIRKIKVSLSF